jgi:uncharacterized damage-inducible protein DinB
MMRRGFHDMNADDARALIAYNRWANDRMLDDVRPLDAAQLTADLATSFRSVIGTLAHLYWAEWLWLRRWQRESPKQLLSLDRYRMLGDVEQPWRDVQAEQERFAGELTDERLRERIGYENFRDERWEYSLARMIQHLLNHSSYHRGQVVTLLRQLGRVPRATDLLVWIDEAGGTP